ncbi:MAG TPA: hypothetical protein VJX67_19100 [Blastocatellia bacterium]|nr:hypothetical protein [Blastocatellia bacterium]
MLKTLATILIDLAVVATVCASGSNQPRPISLAGGTTQAEAKKPAAAEGSALPTVDQVLDHYVKALGGKDAIEKQTSRVMKGTIEVTTFNVNGTVEVDAKAPNKIFTLVSIEGFGDIKSGFDGTAGWDDNPQTGIRDMTPVQTAAYKARADFHRPIHLKELYKDLKVTGKEKVGDHDAYVLEYSAPEGPGKFYFDVESGLLAKTVAPDVTSEAGGEVEELLDNYKDVDGVKAPFQIHHNSQQVNFVITFSDASSNNAIEEY